MRRKLLAAALAAAMLLGCSVSACAAGSSAGEVRIQLSDSGVKVDGKDAPTDTSSTVYVGGGIIYYAEGTDETYGAGSESEKHSADEAAAHTVVTITQPGTYRISGALSQGQIFVDLGEDAKTDPDAVVTLILDGADITCTVAPAVFFYRVYECDTQWVAYDEGESEEYSASGTADTSAAGANVILAAGSENHITGSHVARIYQEGTAKKLHKYDGAFYSRMSMNIDGENGDDSGVLCIAADNEGLDSELHLTINGGTIDIQSQDDGINTNEDFVSVTTINGGSLTINAGLGSEGDGIDSNGYLTINGGTIWTMSNESSPDGGIDADGAITINGGTLYAFGTRNDAVDSASAQLYMELSFASTLPAGSVISLADPEGGELFRVTTQKTCQSLTVSAPELEENVAYSLYVDGVQQQYTGNQTGGFGGGQPPAGFDPTQTERPEGGRPGQDGQRPEGQEPPEGFDPAQTERPEGTPRPEDGTGGFRPGQGGGQAESGEGSAEFTLTQRVRSFYGVSDSPDGSGKTRVSFTVNGGKGMTSVASGERVLLTEIQASVDDLPDSDVQITITDVPSEDYAETCLLSDGEEALAAILPTEDGIYRLTVGVVSGNETYAGVNQWQFTVGALPFSDVRQGSQDYDSIKAVYDAGLMEGTGNGRFEPNGTVTRAQAAAVLARLARAEVEDSAAFTDVRAGSWYSGYVGWASSNGIVEGDGQGHFLPEASVTGAQMELMLTRCAQLARMEYEASNTSDQPLTRGELAQMLTAFL